MKEQRKWAVVLATFAVFVTTAAFLPGLVRAGNLEPSTPPGSTMHTLDEIYQKLEQIVPDGGPAPVAKTGHTTSYADRATGTCRRVWPGRIHGSQITETGR